MKFAAYCRVSTNHAEQLESLRNQEEFFRSFAEKNGHSLVRIYSDEGISGRQMKKRTAFLEMLSDAERGEFEMVAVKDISRFARNTVDFLTAIRRLREYGIEVCFLSVNQTVLGNSEFILTIFSAMAQEESANLSSRVRFGMNASAKKGRVPTRVFGYRHAGAYALEINQSEALTVQNIFSMYSSGHSLREISDKLYEKNIPTFSGAERWTPKTLTRILKNPLYRGVLITKKTEGTNYLSGKRKALSETDDEYVFEREEYRIVSDRLFFDVQELLVQRRCGCVGGR